MSKTVQIRCYTEDLPRVEDLRRKLSISQGGQRVTFADTVRWLLELAKQEKAGNDGKPKVPTLPQ